jgi:hypothetical protein
MTYIYKLEVSTFSKDNDEYYASLEGVSEAAYEIYTYYLFTNDIIYDREAILELVSPAAIKKSLEEEETIYNKRHIRVQLIAAGSFELHVVWLKLND